MTPWMPATLPGTDSDGMASKQHLRGGQDLVSVDDCQAGHAGIMALPAGYGGAGPSIQNCSMA